MAEIPKEKTLSPKEIEERKKKDKWIRTTLLAVIVTSLDIIILAIGVDQSNNHGINLGWTVAAIGIVTFFGMLIVSSFHKKDTPEGDKGTMRDALTASLISTYFAVLAYSMFEKINSGNTSVDTILSNFSYVIITVVVFYFGSKGVSEIYKKKVEIAKSSKRGPEK